MYMKIMYLVLLCLHAILRWPIIFVALSAAGQAKGASLHHDACLESSRAPWRVL